MNLLLYDMVDLAIARVRLAQGRGDEVVEMLDDISDRSARIGHAYHLIQAKMLLARARWMSGAASAALSDLDVALGLAAPEGYARIFLDEGEPMADLLADYVATRPSSRERSYALTLLAAFGRTVEAPIALLSARELDVLRLLARGHSNEDIAGKLCVALSTVKWHLANISRKFGVSGRGQIVTHARERHLLA